MLNLALVLTAFFAVSVIAAPHFSDFNEFFDNVLNDSLTAKIDEIEPLKVPEFAFRFDRQIILARVTGEAGFTNIEVEGLSGLKRIDSSTIETLADKNLKVTITLSAKGLKITSKGQIKLNEVGPERTYTGRIKKVVCRMAVAHNPDTDEITLDSFKVLKTDGLSIRVVGSSIGRMGDAVSNAVLKVAIIPFRKAINVAIGLVVQRILSDEIGQIQFLKKALGSRN